MTCHMTNLREEDVEDVAGDGEREGGGEESEEPGRRKHRHTEVLRLEVVEQVRQLLLQQEKKRTLSWFQYKILKTVFT